MLRLIFSLVLLIQASVILGSESNNAIFKEVIPDTKLRTNTLYKLGLKSFPGGVVTWVSEAKDSYNYLIIDNDPFHHDSYAPGNINYGNTWWEFTSSHYCGDDWYLLENRGKPGAFAAYTKDENILLNSNEYYLVLDRNYIINKNREIFCLKPIEVDEKGVAYYQLKMKAVPTAHITWSAQSYGVGGSHYMQMDNSTNDNYEKGGEWFGDTLFTIDRIKSWE